MFTVFNQLIELLIKHGKIFIWIHENSDLITRCMERANEVNISNNYYGFNCYTSIVFLCYHGENLVDFEFIEQKDIITLTME